MSAARQIAWIGLGLVTGAVTGVIWGWLGSDGYETPASSARWPVLRWLAGRGWVVRRGHRR